MKPYFSENRDQVQRAIRINNPTRELEGRDANAPTPCRNRGSLFRSLLYFSKGWVAEGGAISEKFGTTVFRAPDEFTAHIRHLLRTCAGYVVSIAC